MTANVSYGVSTAYMTKARDMARADVTTNVAHAVPTADMTTADMTAADVAAADVPAANTTANVATADVTTAGMPAANTTANVATADMTTADMAASGMTTNNMTAAAVTASMPPTVTTAVLGEGWRTAQADHQHGDHREQGQPWKNCRAHGQPPMVGPGRDRSSAVPGVSIILGTVQRPIFPSCVGNGSCSSNGATVRPTQPPALRDDSGGSGKDPWPQASSADRAPSPSPQHRRW
ncbi:MAG: hypothetical protein IH830_05970 [Planctomycetes bacterium]|nr:hypothetical protein [Planctomycetota bacterium]